VPSVTDAVNRDRRVLYLDIARGFAVLFMFTQHCMLIHETRAGDSEHLLSLIFTLLGTAPAAPVFMVLMGAFQMKSRAPVKRQILRGAKLFALGGLLNLLRLPMLVSVGEGGRILFAETARKILVFNDILQLAGLSYILGALIRPLMTRRFITPLLIPAVLLVSPSLWGLFPENPLFLMLWGTGEMINFPFFPWMVYPLMGMYLSPFLLGRSAGAGARGGREAESEDREEESDGREAESEDRDGIPDSGVQAPGSPETGLDRRLTRLALSGLGLLGAGEVLIIARIVPVGDYSRSGLGVHLLITGFVLIWLKICRMMEMCLSPDRPFVRMLIFLSVNITKVYFIQWILFAWSIIPLGANRQDPWTSALIGLIVFLMSCAFLKILPGVKRALRTSL
jgi:hypothetical protein